MPETYLKTCLHALADLAMPRLCAVCGKKLLPDEDCLCEDCNADMPLTRFHLLRENPMADKFNALLARRSEDFVPYVRACAYIFYFPNSPYRAIPKALKYHRNFALGRRVASSLGDLLAGSDLFADVDLVIPVPLHWARHFRRGYNQAQVIAEAVAERLPCARVSAHVLKRVKRTLTQTKQSTEGKGSNVAGAFKAADRGLHPNHVLIVDDVFTTGSTMLACYEALREVFPVSVRISIAAISYAEN